MNANPLGSTPPPSLESVRQAATTFHRQSLDSPGAQSQLATLRARIALCQSCPTTCANPEKSKMEASCPLTPPRWGPFDATKAPASSTGLGDMVEKLAKPIAKALRLKCLDGNGQLKPESGCAKRKAWLNSLAKR